MRILHTSDWHVGRTIGGRSRIDEQRAVLAEIVALARSEKADLVLVAGDLFESAAPSAEAQSVVWDALLALARTGAQLALIAGNHDNQRQLHALRPMLEALGIIVLAQAAPAHEGGVVEIPTSGSERARLALLPFCSQRAIVDAAALMSGTAADHAATYAERMKATVAALTAGFDRPGAVNIVMAHGTVRGGKLGGGERDAQSIFDYWFDAAIFPAACHYVALGHLHRAQRMEAPCPVWYCGSPLHVDFSEEEDDKGVLLVEATATAPATVEKVPLSAGRRLRTLRGDLALLRRAAGGTGDAWLRIFVREPPRPGLADEVRALFPHAVQVQLDASARVAAAGAAPHADVARAGPHELVRQFLELRGESDPRLLPLFARLLEAEMEEQAVVKG